MPHSFRIDPRRGEVEELTNGLKEILQEDLFENIQGVELLWDVANNRDIYKVRRMSDGKVLDIVVRTDDINRHTANVGKFASFLKNDLKVFAKLVLFLA